MIILPKNSGDQIGSLASPWAEVHGTLVYIAGTQAAKVTHKLDDFGAPDDNTDLDATTGRHGLMSKLDKIKLDAINLSAITDGDMLKSVYDPGNVAGNAFALANMTGTLATSQLADGAVTLTKMANIATASLLGRSSAGNGVPEVLSASTVRSILNVADGANNYTLPAPTTTVIGGVKRNTGTSGQYVSGIDTDGALLYGTPAGGASITGTGLAYVRSGGNDTTGTIGDPSLPYATAQAAWDDGARNFELGSGSYTITHYSSSDGSGEETVRAVGLGKTVSSLTVNWLGTTSTEESPAGKTPNKLILLSDQSVSFTLNLQGGDAHSGDENGGNSPTFNWSGCYIDAISRSPGSGSGSGMSGSESGGDLRWCDIPSLLTGSEASSYYATLVRDSGHLVGEIDYNGTALSTTISALEARHITENKVLASAFTNSTGVSSDVSTFSCSIAAGETLAIEIVGLHTGNAAGSGIGICFTGPASPAHVEYGFSHYSSTSAVRAVAAATAYGTDLVELSGATDILPFSVFFTVTNGSTAGTIQFKARSENSGTSMTIRRGALMRISRT